MEETREAKAIACCTASRDQKTRELRKDKGSGADGGDRRTSDFVARLERTAHRNGVFEAKELAVCPTGRPRSGRPPRRSSPDGMRPSSSTSTMPSNMRPPQCGS